ncbi:MAG: hypothetical protein DRH37_05560 [Deltaproteobacteria bacterium]|nr:MAG: hypothetical protein DRH37_05560 [Deltaproteobacteria bacterium]
MARIITVTSGKGGVGKTNISANLAICLADQGYRTCLFDTDLGLANINILLGLYPEHDLGDLISGEKHIKDILIRDFKGVDIIPGSSGIEKIADLDSEKVERLIKGFSELDADYDFFIFDTSAGVSKNVISFCLASSDIILVLKPEPTSLTDAYALIKILSLNGYEGAARVIVNQCTDMRSSRIVYAKFSETLRKFLSVKLLFLGAIFHDPNVSRAVKLQEPFVTLSPKSVAAICIRRIATELTGREVEESGAFSFGAFWEKCLRAFRQPLRFTGPNAVEELEKFEHLLLEKRELMDQYSKGEDGQTLGNETVSSFPEQSFPVTISEDANTTEEIRVMLERLIGRVSDLSQDISEIKQFLQNTGAEKPGIKTPSEDTGISEATIVPLDFEAFLERRGSI